MSKPVASPAGVSPQSQLKNLPTAGAKPANVTDFGRFVLADVKGGAYKQAYRLSQVSLAIEQALKGNFTPITEAVAASQGKIDLCSAYQAGFAAVGVRAGSCDIAKVPYTGKLADQVNKQARENIELQRQQLLSAFTGAFETCLTDIKAIAKAKAEAKKALKAATTEQEKANVAEANQASETATETDLPVGEVSDINCQAMSVLAALQGGLLSDEATEAFEDFFRTREIAALSQQEQQPSAVH